MIIIKDFIKYDNANALEVTWVNREIGLTLITVEKEIDGKIVKVEEEQEIIIDEAIQCHSYADVQMDILRTDAKKYNTSLNEYEHIIKEVEANIKPLSDEQLQEIEQNRILCIKSKAKELIELKYPTYKQMNILMSSDELQIKIMNDYILAIRNISNKAEQSNLNYDDIDWNI